MASLELDPGFSRALRLLHSKSKDSEDQLRTMLDEAIKQRHGTSKTLPLLLFKKEVASKRDISKPSTSTSGGRKDEQRKETEKKNYEKMDESTKAFSKRNTSPAPTQQDDDDDGLALEILEEDLTCVVCRGMDVVARNQLVECVECHSLYHQECHQPPVAETDMNDPRSAWYCSNCTKTMSKVQRRQKKTTTPGTSGSYAIHVLVHQGTVHHVTTGTPPPSFCNVGGKPMFSILAPKNRNISPPTLTKTFGGTPQSILKPKPTVISPAQKCVMPNINIISADKRLQIMKKKAAKMQEKRKHSK